MRDDACGIIVLYNCMTLQVTIEIVIGSDRGRKKKRGGEREEYRL